MLARLGTGHNNGDGASVLDIQMLNRLETGH